MYQAICGRYKQLDSSHLPNWHHHPTSRLNDGAYYGGAHAGMIDRSTSSPTGLLAKHCPPVYIRRVKQTEQLNGCEIDERTAASWEDWE